MAEVGHGAGPGEGSGAVPGVRADAWPGPWSGAATDVRGRGAHGVRRGAGRWAAAAGLGALVGVVGTVLHRSSPPWGVALCLALVLSSTVLVRAWAGLLPVVAYAAAWLVVVQGLSLSGPGGDVLVPAGDPLGYVWGLGGMVVVGVACFLPSRWFRDAPAGPAAPATGTSTGTATGTSTGTSTGTATGTATHGA